MNRLAKLIAIGSVLWGSTASGAVMYFTPSGTATVSQSTDLWWDITSSNTSTAGAIGPVTFELTDHGDFHHSSGSDMIDAAGSSAGVDLSIGTLIGLGTDFGDNGGFTGTTGFGGGCAVGNTCIYGLSFQLAGNTHFGWVRFFEDVSTQGLVDWAYESTALASIAAGVGASSSVPAPGGLALLLAGIAGFANRSALARLKTSLVPQAA